MIQLSQYLNESVNGIFEGAADRHLEPDCDNFINYLRSSCAKYVDGDKLKLSGGFISFDEIRAMYDYYNEKHKPCPVVVEYNGPGTFAFRRWVEKELADNFKNYDILHGKIGKPYYGSHNTKLKEDGHWFPSAGDMECLICFAYNLRKDSGARQFEDSLKGMAFAEDGKGTHVNTKTQLMLGYYADNADDFEDIVKVMPPNMGTMHKLPNIKGSVTNEWIELGEFKTRNGVLNNTPKTDIISDNGKYRVSLKKSGRGKKGAQLMSGKECESLATIKVAMRDIDDPELQRIANRIFSISWGSNLSKRGDAEYTNKRAVMRENNEKLTSLIRKLSADPSFKKAIMMEAATGKVKFGKNAPSTATTMLVWDDESKGGSQFYDDIETYIDEHVSSADFNISLKTVGEGTTFTALRIVI